MPGHIVSPSVIEVIIQEDWGKQAEFKWRSGSEAFDDLPGVNIVFVRVGSHEIEVELVGVGFGEEIAPAGEIFQVEELVFFEAMDGLDITLVSVGRGRDAHMLAAAQGFGEIALELAAVVGLPNQIAERDTVAIQVLLDASGEDGTGRGLRPWAKAQKSKPLRTSRAVY